MNLREEFVAASNAKSDDRLPWEFGPVAGQLAVFAQSIPARVQEAIVRMHGGQPLYELDKDTLSMNFTAGYLFRNHFDYSTLEKLPGYRQLVTAAADPANDIAFRLEISTGHNKSGKFETRFEVTLSPSEPFSASTLRFSGDREPSVFLRLGENGVPSWAQTKPKVKLSVPAQANS